MTYQQPTPNLDIARPDQANRVGTAPTPSSGSIEAIEIGGSGIARQTKLVLTNVPITFTRTSSSIATGSIQIYDFPKGCLCYKGGTAKIAFAGLTASAANAVASVGTTAATTANATLTTTEADLIDSTAAALVSGVGTFLGSAGSTASKVANLDGSGTAKDVYLNLATADDITSTRTGTVSGWVILNWETCGDNTIA